MNKPEQSIRRIAAYIRVSSEEQRDRGSSPEFQRSTIKDWRNREHAGAEISLFEDLGYSGNWTRRTGPISGVCYQL